MKNHKSENRLSQNRREGYRAVSLLLGRWFFVELVLVVVVVLVVVEVLSEE